MKRNVFFSFDYKDVSSFRANVVRNSWLTKTKGNQASFTDGSIWEEARSKSQESLKKLIEEEGLYRTSVTCVLVGSNTYERRWVKYELVKSFEKGNGIIAVHINRIRNNNGRISEKGKNPLDYLAFKVDKETNLVKIVELNNRQWIPYKDLPVIKNLKTNSVYFEPLTFWEKFTGNNKFEKLYRFSDFFKTYCWINNNGNTNFTNWINEAYENIIY